MTPGGLAVKLDEIARLEISAMSKREAASVIAEKIIEKYGDDLKKEVMESITIEDVRHRVLDGIADEIIENWKDKE